jgi:hypothetical protein
VMVMVMGIGIGRTEVCLLCGEGVVYEENTLQNRNSKNERMSATIQKSNNTTWLCIHLAWCKVDI